MKTVDIDDLKAGEVIDALTVSRAEPICFLEAMYLTSAKHVLQLTRESLDGDSKLAELLESRADVQVKDAEAFLLASNYVCFDFTFHDSDSKDRSLDSFLKTIERVSRLNARGRQLEKIAVELTLNALYSSVSSFKRMTGGEYSHHAKAPCTLRLAFDDRMAVVSCHDPVGSLSREKLLTGLLTVYRKGNSIDIKPKPEEREVMQSGIGCKIIFDNCTDIYAVSKMMKGTWVAARIPLLKSAKDFQRLPKGFHLVTRE